MIPTPAYFHEYALRLKNYANCLIQGQNSPLLGIAKVIDLPKHSDTTRVRVIESEHEVPAASSLFKFFCPDEIQSIESGTREYVCQLGTIRLISAKICLRMDPQAVQTAAQDVVDQSMRTIKQILETDLRLQLLRYGRKMCATCGWEPTRPVNDLRFPRQRPVIIEGKLDDWVESISEQLAEHGFPSFTHGYKVLAGKGRVSYHNIKNHIIDKQPLRFNRFNKYREPAKFVEPTDVHYDPPYAASSMPSRRYTRARHELFFVISDETMRLAIDSEKWVSAEWIQGPREEDLYGDTGFFAIQLTRMWMPLEPHGVYVVAFRRALSRKDLLLSYWDDVVDWFQNLRK
jgi:hypothetical protein